MTNAIVTGGASGIGAAIVSRLRHQGLEVEVLDLTTGFDVGESEAWETVEAPDVACLNAGVLGGPPDPADLTLGEYVSFSSGAVGKIVQITDAGATGNAWTTSRPCSPVVG